MAMTEERPPLWQVVLTYLTGFAAIVLLSVVSALIVRAAYPDVPESLVLDGLPGLLAGGVASSTALVLTLLLRVRPFEPARLRLAPGRETGPALAVMLLGTIALGQSLDSLTMLAGLGHHGTMEVIRRALEGAVGPALFVAVVVIGLMAGTAEEVFFRGYMQTALRARWRPAVAVPVTAAAFGVLHLEWLHALLAFFLGLYLGFIAELSGSALPAVVCHVLNNVAFTLLTALGGTVEGFPPNLALAVGGVLVLAGCVGWLLRALPRS
jgi:membrane protease YdiL (CAAX protease family)